MDRGDSSTILVLKQELRAALPESVTLVCPLAFGNHVDHQLTRMAADQLGLNIYYYADYPYVLRYQAKIEQMLQAGWECQVFSISGDGVRAWQDSISSHHSQISTFWPGEEEMRRAIETYVQGEGGIRLWRRAEG